MNAYSLDLKADLRWRFTISRSVDDDIHVLRHLCDMRLSIKNVKIGSLPEQISPKSAGPHFCNIIEMKPTICGYLAVRKITCGK